MNPPGRLLTRGVFLLARVARHPAERYKQDDNALSTPSLPSRLTNELGDGCSDLVANRAARRITTKDETIPIVDKQSP